MVFGPIRPSTSERAMFASDQIAQSRSLTLTAIRPLDGLEISEGARGGAARGGAGGGKTRGLKGRVRLEKGPPVRSARSLKRCARSALGPAAPIQTRNASPA